MEEEIEALRREVRHLIAMNTAAYLAITSLVATHPDPQQLQLHLIASLEGILGRAVEAGGTIVSQPKASPWGLRAVLADPDGNRVEIVEGAE